MAPRHPGFRRVVATIASRTNPGTGKPYGKERAERIVAAAARGASARAKRQNPRLRRVS
jgi:hypothetical protein